MWNVFFTRVAVLFLSISLIIPTPSFAWKSGQDNSKQICNDKGFSNPDGQAIEYCKAIDSSTQAKKGLQDVVKLDLAAAAICWAEYAASKSPGGAAITGLCGGAAMAAGALELYHVINTLNRRGPAGDYKVDATTGDVKERSNGSDTVKVLIGAGVMTEGLRIAACYYNMSDKLCGAGKRDYSNYDKAINSPNTDPRDAKGFKKDLQEDKASAREQLALEAALIFTALGAARGVNLMNANATVKNAEAALDMLKSSAVTAGNGAAQNQGHAFSSGYGSSENTTTTNAPIDLAALAAPESLMMPRISALGKKAAELAARIPSSALNNGNFGALAARMASGMGAGDTSGLTSTASKVESYMANLPSSSQGSYASGGGGGLGGGKSVSDGTNLNLGALFGQNGAQQAAGPEGQIAFRSPANAGDIWHAHTDQNLFQIVSGKYGSVSPKLGQ